MTNQIKPVYFENQRQAASILGIDVEDLKEWKARGCPAFKYGRIYHEPLLEWMNEEKLRRMERKEASMGEATKRRYITVRTMMGLAELANFKILSDEQFFKFGRAIVEAAGDKEIREIFTDMIYGWLRGMYSELDAAFEAHPEITYWIIRERLMTPEERAKLPAELPQRTKSPAGGAKCRGRPEKKTGRP